MQSTACGSDKRVIIQYFASHHCAVCDTLSQAPVCPSCRDDPQTTVCRLTDKVRQWDKTWRDVRKICGSCIGFADPDACLSLDCPVVYKRRMAGMDAEQIDYVLELMEDIEL